MDKQKYFGALEEDFVSPFDTGELTVIDTFYVRYVKRLFDICISLFAIIFTFPIKIVIGILPFFDVGRPIFFTQDRPGLAEKPFKIIKFRNMTNDVDQNGVLLPPEQRVTKFGSFVRKTSLDELLQFWLILRGKMSIIGPRPLLMKYLPNYSMKQHRRHAVKPGLECPMSVYTSEVLTWEERFKNDVWYVDHISFRTDCIMMIRLFKLVFNKKRGKARSNKIDKEFGGK